jgi:hypothetical protein
LTLALAATLACAVQLAAAPGSKDADKERDGQKIDSGSFGVYMGGKRVGTETFAIYQARNGSVTTSEFKTENAPTEAVQKSELQLSGTGELRRYEWKEISPEAAESTVLPNDQFLTQKSSTGPQGKELEQPYLLSPTTSILDDYFFIHRELLAWKLMGAVCKKEGGPVQCMTRQRAQFGTLNPHQHSSAPLTGEYMGRDKVNFKGAQREFDKFELRSEAETWDLWLDDQFKIQRMVIESANTEVIRD